MSSKRSQKKVGLFVFLAVSLLLYFGFYALWGPRGYLNYRVKKTEYEMLEQDHQKLVARRQELEDRVKKLSSKSLDLDLLEERVRVMLNYVHPDEWVIYEGL